MPKEGDIVIHRIRNTRRIPVLTIAYAIKNEIVYFGIAICSPKDKPVKRKGDLIAISRLTSGRCYSKFMHKLQTNIFVCGSYSRSKFEREVERLSEAIKSSSYYNG